MKKELFVFVFMVGNIGIRIDERRDLVKDIPVFNEIKNSGRYYLALSRDNLGDDLVLNKLSSLNVMSKKLTVKSQNMSPTVFLDSYFD